MEKKHISNLLSVYLSIVLLLVAVEFLFVFIINWEDWFFGIKLDGWPAGIFLLSKAVVAGLLAYLVLKDKNKLTLWSSVSIVFLAFVFVLPVFSSQRNLRSDMGWTIFWIELVVLIVIPLILLIVSLFQNRMDQKE